MRATYLITVLTTCFTLTFNFAQLQNCPEAECSYKAGDRVYLFGNNVKLRTAPNTESTVLELLKIGEWVEIIEKTNTTWPYKGFESPFYKVKYDDMTGYILGGLFAFQRKTLSGVHYFFAYSKEGPALFLNIRSIREGSYIEDKVQLSHANIDIKTMDNRGLTHLDGILYIDYYAEACSMEGGGIYFFAHDDTLTQVAQLSQISEAGIFYYSEQFIFPDEERGIPEKICFKKEQGQNLDEASLWTHSSVETRQLVWDNGQLTPDFREKITN